MEYFHISYVGRVPLLYPIINRLNALKKDGTRANQFGVWRPKMGDAAIALITKIRLVQIAAARLERDIKKLDVELSERTGVIDDCIARKRALVLQNDELGFVPPGPNYLIAPASRQRSRSSLL
jgi:hypothetical protein